MAGADFNQQLFASGQMQGSLGAHGGGQDGKKSSVPLLAMLGVKDARGWLNMLDTPGIGGILGGDTGGIGGMFTPKSGDKFIQAFQNTGSGNGTSGIGEGGHFQAMVASSRGDSSERTV